MWSDSHAASTMHEQSSQSQSWSIVKPQWLCPGKIGIQSKFSDYPQFAYESKQSSLLWIMIKCYSLYWLSLINIIHRHSTNNTEPVLQTSMGFRGPCAGFVNNCRNDFLNMQGICFQKGRLCFSGLQMVIKENKVIFYKEPNPSNGPFVVINKSQLSAKCKNNHLFFTK